LLFKNTRQNSYVLKLFRQSTHIVSLQNLRNRLLITCPPENRHNIDHVFNSNNVHIDFVLLQKLYLGLRMSRCTKLQDSLLMSLSSKKTANAVIMSQNPTISSHGCPSKTMLRSLNVCFVAKSRRHIPMTCSSEANHPLTLYISKTTTYPPCPLLQTLQKPFMSCAQILGDLLSMSGSHVLLPKDRAKTLDVVCIKFQGNS
jgi:hypothetical protein